MAPPEVDTPQAAFAVGGENQRLAIGADGGLRFPTAVAVDLCPQRLGLLPNATNTAHTIDVAIGIASLVSDDGIVELRAVGSEGNATLRVAAVERRRQGNPFTEGCIVEALAAAEEPLLLFELTGLEGTLVTGGHLTEVIECLSVEAEIR